MQLELSLAGAEANALDRLTSEQREAVEAPGRETLVVAAAGSGKTKLLIERLFWALQDGQESAIVALTFSEKAGAEMRHRAEQRVLELSKVAARRFYQRVSIATIDAYCLKVLSDNPLAAGWSGERLLPPDDLAHYLRATAFEAALDAGLASETIGVELGELTPALLQLMTLRRLRRPAGDRGNRAEDFVRTAQRQARSELSELNQALGLASTSQDYAEEIVAIERAIKGRRLGPEGEQLRLKLKRLAKRVELFAPEGAERSAAYERLVALAATLESNYERWKTERLAFDFADLETAAVALLASSREPSANGGTRASALIGHLLIDEAQDLNPLQERLLSLLGQDAKVFRVGDPRQAIYAFRDADLDGILRKRAELPPEQCFELTVNHRSAPGILDLANHFWAAIAPAGENFRPMQPSNRLPRQPDQPAVELLAVHRDRLQNRVAQAHVTAQLILELGQSPKNIAVLCRTSDAARLIYAVLCEAAVPATLGVRVKLADKAIFADAVALLRAFDQPDDDFAIYAALRTGVFGGSLADVLALKAQSGQSALASLGQSSMNGRSELVRRAFLELLGEGRLWPRQRLLAALLGRCQLGAAALAFAPVLNALAETDGLGLTLSEIIERLAAATVDEVEGQSDGVAVMTIHAAKGLEWNTVVLPFSDRRFASGHDPGQVLSLPRGIATLAGPWPPDPTSTAIKLELERREREEECRLSYVALTRARQRLFILGAASRTKKLGEPRDQAGLWQVLRAAYGFFDPELGESKLVGHTDDPRQAIRLRGVAPSTPRDANH